MELTCVILMASCIFQQLYQVMKAKAAQKQNTNIVRQITILRNRSSKMAPIANIEDEDSPLFNTLALNRQIQQAKKIEIRQKLNQLDQLQDFLMPQTNKIYNANLKVKQVTPFSIGCKKDPKASLKDLAKNKYQCVQEQIECRPKTSYLNKFQNSEIFKDNNDVLNYEKRPGSSKSSRLFKRKGGFPNETVNSENEERQPPTIRLASVGGVRNKNITTSGGARNRVGTSLKHTKGAETIPTKLDPTFYRLFAK